MDDQCQTQADVLTPDIFSTAADLAEKIGAGAVCKKAAETAYANGSVSYEAKMQAEVLGQSASAGAAGQATYMEGQNSMSEEGCGPIAIAAQKMYNNSKKMQCIMQKSAQASNTNVNIVNSIKIGNVPLSEKEINDLKAATEQFNAKPVPNIKDYEIPMPPYELINDPEKYAKLAEALTKAKTENHNEAVKIHNSILDSIKNLYSRDADFTNFNSNQSIKANIKTKISLSTADLAKVENLSKQTADAVTQASMEQKMGLNALTPSAKSASETSIQNMENLSSSSINSKVQNTSVNVNMENVLEIWPAGKLTMKNVTLSQDIIADVATDILISSAVDAGLKAASEMTTTSSVSTVLKQESAGVEALAEAQGKANAAAISAAKVSLPATGGGILSGIAGVVLFIYILERWDNFPSPAKVTFVLVFGMVIAVLIACVYIMYQNISGILRYIRKLTGAETPQDIEVSFKYPLILYNKLWKEGYGCTRDLEMKDITDKIWFISATPEPISLEDPNFPITAGQIKEAFQNKRDLAESPEATDEDILFCYTEGVVPLSLKKIKKKQNSDLTDDEITFLWVNVSKCDPEQYKKIIQENYRAMKNIDEILDFMKKTYYEKYVSVKKPKDLTETDIRFLWRYAGCFDNDNIFKKIVIEKDTLEKYTVLSSIDAVLAQLKTNK
jgi:hypothetical protein